MFLDVFLDIFFFVHIFHLLRSHIYWSWRGTRNRRELRVDTEGHFGDIEMDFGCLCVFCVAQWYELQKDIFLLVIFERVERRKFHTLKQI